MFLQQKVFSVSLRIGRSAWHQVQSGIFAHISLLQCGWPGKEGFKPGALREGELAQLWGSDAEAAKQSSWGEVNHEEHTANEQGSAGVTSSICMWVRKSLWRACTPGHTTWDINMRNWRSVCSCRGRISSGSQGCRGWTECCCGGYRPFRNGWPGRQRVHGAWSAWGWMMRVYG